MFWDKVAPVYNLFENIYNGKVNKEMCNKVASFIDSDDCVLECACGAGMISMVIAQKAKTLIATDYSKSMLNQTKKNCSKYSNVKFESSNIMDLKYESNSFDKVVAGNVIHLLDEPYEAIEELLRVCKIGGKVIIPTYVNNKEKSSRAVKVWHKLGAGFKKQFTYDKYKEFFKKGNYNPDFYIIPGRMPSAIAVIEKDKQ